MSGACLWELYNRLGVVGTLCEFVLDGREEVCDSGVSF